MPFALLITLIVLAFVIPMVLIAQSNKKSKHSDKHLPKNTPEKSTNKLINIHKLPNIFQQILIDIEQQFADIINIDATTVAGDEVYFGAKKIFYQRLPEIVENYLQLKPTYAKNHIIDNEKQLTTYDITLQQLKSILNYFHQINRFHNQKHIQTTLVNQRYLNAIYSQAGITHSSQSSVTSLYTDANLQQSMDFAEADLSIGQQYLNDYCTYEIKLTETKLTPSFVAEIGQLVYLASITQVAVEQHLEYELSKLSISSEYGFESLEKLLVVKLPDELVKVNTHPQHKPALLVHFSTLKSLLENILSTLDKDIRLDIKLHQLQKIDDNIWQIVNDSW